MRLGWGITQLQLQYWNCESCQRDLLEESSIARWSARCRATVIPENLKTCWQLGRKRNTSRARDQLSPGANLIDKRTVTPPSIERTQHKQISIGSESYSTSLSNEASASMASDLIVTDNARPTQVRLQLKSRHADISLPENTGPILVNTSTWSSKRDHFRMTCAKSRPRFASICVVNLGQHSSPDGKTHPSGVPDQWYLSPDDP